MQQKGYSKIIKKLPILPLSLSQNITSIKQKTPTMVPSNYRFFLYIIIIIIILLIIRVIKVKFKIYEW
jgi:hypothetical protein